jgi:hypothetical protein
MLVLHLFLARYVHVCFNLLGFQFFATLQVLFSPGGSARMPYQFSKEVKKKYLRSLRKSLRFLGILLLGLIGWLLMAWYVLSSLFPGFFYPVQITQAGFSQEYLDVSSFSMYKFTNTLSVPVTLCQGVHQRCDQHSALDGDRITIQPGATVLISFFPDRMPLSGSYDRQVTVTLQPVPGYIFTHINLDVVYRDPS